jgi:Fanconi anemia group M protein
VTLVFGLPVLRSAFPEETADLILFAEHQLRRRTSRPPRRPYEGITTTRRTQLRLLQSIPEVGPLKAQLLLSAFGNPAGVAAATIERIAEVDGIGPKTALRIHEVLHHPQPDARQR